MISHEIVANWFFRLNGFLTIPGFVVHPEHAGTQITDVDVLGVRFPYRREVVRGPLRDAFPAGKQQQSLFLALGEVKSGQCEVNRVLADPQTGGLRKTLMASGVVSEEKLKEVCDSVWESGAFDNPEIVIAHVCIGREVDPDITEELPGVHQITWEYVLAFIFDRFSRYRGPKASHPQWDAYGQFLWVAAARFHERSQFIEFLMHSMKIGAST